MNFDKFVNAQDMSSSFNSPGKRVKVNGFSVQVTFTGAPVGVAKLQGSNDNVDFDDIPDATKSVSAPGMALWNVQDAYYAYIRLVWVMSSGTGNISALYADKARVGMPHE